jgi:steroid 5-alpha reductase family enzyme
MSLLILALHGLGVLAVAAVLTWGASLPLRNVSIVDSLWPLLFLLLALTYAIEAGRMPRTGLLIALVAIWSLRLASHITWRNRGHGEDRRYQAIRARNQPHFELKSLYLVFLLQAVLAWIIGWPLLGALVSSAPLGLLDAVGLALWLTGFLFEAVGDAQLTRFKADPANRGRVMDRGLWRYTRHPNYFGDCMLWWGFYAIALGAHAGWSIVGPLLMSFLLLRVSGVSLLEKDIGERRPAYADYVRRTNAFFPGPPRAAG